MHTLDCLPDIYIYIYIYIYIIFICYCWRIMSTNNCGIIVVEYYI